MVRKAQPPPTGSRRVALDSATLIVANLAIAVSAFVALVFGILQVRAASRDRRERLTIEAIRGFQTREFATHMMWFRDHPPPATVAAWYAMDPDVRVTYVHVAQEMEMLGLLVYDGTLDLDLVERTLGTFVSDSWGKFKAGTEALRAELKDPHMSEYYQWLAERVADFESFHLANEATLEFISDLFMNDEAFGRDAGLPVVDRASFDC